MILDLFGNIITFDGFIVYEISLYLYKYICIVFIYCASCTVSRYRSRLCWQIQKFNFLDIISEETHRWIWWKHVVQISPILPWSRCLGGDKWSSSFSSGLNHTPAWIATNRKWKYNRNNIKIDALEVSGFRKPIILPSWPFSGSYVTALDVLSIGYPVRSRLWSSCDYFKVFRESEMGIRDFPAIWCVGSSPPFSFFLYRIFSSIIIYISKIILYLETPEIEKNISGPRDKK